MRYVSRYVFVRIRNVISAMPLISFNMKKEKIGL